MASNEILTIRLGHRPANQADVSWGWTEGMSQDDAWAAGCKAWVLKASRAIECRTALVLNPDCQVVAQAGILGIRKETVDGDRFEILGELERDGAHVGKTVMRGRSQNPIAYITAESL